MFTGIIEQIGRIENIENARFTISHNFKEDFEIGESIALSGMCSTVVKINNSKNKKFFEVDIMEVSRQKTIFENIKVGDDVNLERSAIIGQRNSGHNVTGHIDQVGEILILEQKLDYVLFQIAVKPENRKLIVPQGSVAVDGISLTVSNVSDLNTKLSPDSNLKVFVESGLEQDYWFEVSIIPHTLKHTTLGSKKSGDFVNLEFDILGKYALNLEI